MSSVGKTDHGSVLVQEAEAQSYTNRTDVKSLNQRLIIDNGKMTDDHAEGIEEFSNLFSTKIDYEKYRCGSNYVPAEIAMAMKQEEKNRDVVGIVDDDEYDEGNVLPEYGESRGIKKCLTNGEGPIRDLKSKLFYLVGNNGVRIVQQIGPESCQCQVITSPIIPEWFFLN